MAKHDVLHYKILLQRLQTQRVSSYFLKSDENNNAEVNNIKNFSPDYTILAKIP